MYYKSKVDDFGRIFLSRTILDKMNIHAGDDVLITFRQNKCTVSKAVQTCVICCDPNHLHYVDGVGYLCRNCFQSIQDSGAANEVIKFKKTRIFRIL